MVVEDVAWCHLDPPLFWPPWLCPGWMSAPSSPGLCLVHGTGHMVGTTIGSKWCSWPRGALLFREMCATHITLTAFLHSGPTLSGPGLGVEEPEDSCEAVRPRAQVSG